MQFFTTLSIFRSFRWSFTKEIIILGFRDTIYYSFIYIEEYYINN